MRCTCCNKNLSDFEATRKNAKTGEYMDMCNECIGHLPVDGFQFKTRPDLLVDKVDRFEEQECYE